MEAKKKERLKFIGIMSMAEKCTTKGNSFFTVMPPNSVCLQNCTSNFLIDLKCLEETSNHRQDLDTRQNHSVPDEQQSTAQI